MKFVAQIQYGPQKNWLNFGRLAFGLGVSRHRQSSGVDCCEK